MARNKGEVGCRWSFQGLREGMAPFNIWPSPFDVVPHADKRYKSDDALAATLTNMFLRPH